MVRDRESPDASDSRAQPSAQFIPLVPPRRSRRGLWFGLLGVTLFAVLLGAVYVGITWASDPGTGPSAGAAAPTSSASRTTAAKATPSAKAKAKAKAKGRSTAPAKRKPATHAKSSPPASPLASPAEGALPQSGTRYAFQSAHFAARFPYKPQTASSNTTQQGVHFSFHTVACFESHIGVESLDVSRVPSASGRDQLLRSAGQHLVGGGTVENAKRSTFRHQPAWSMEVVISPGTTLSVLSVIDTSGRVYSMMAPTGAAFTALTSSFASIA